MKDIRNVADISRLTTSIKTIYEKEVEELLLWFDLVDLWDRFPNKGKASFINTSTAIERVKAPGYNTLEVSSEESTKSAGD